MFDFSALLLTDKASKNNKVEIWDSKNNMQSHQSKFSSSRQTGDRVGAGRRASTSPYYKHLAKSLRWILLAELDPKHESCFAIPHYSLASSLFVQTLYYFTKKMSEKCRFLSNTWWFSHVGRRVGIPGVCNWCWVWKRPLKTTVQQCVNMCFCVLFTLNVECVSVTICARLAHSQGWR